MFVQRISQKFLFIGNFFHFFQIGFFRGKERKGSANFGKCSEMQGKCFDTANLTRMLWESLEIHEKHV